MGIRLCLFSGRSNRRRVQPVISWPDIRVEDGEPRKITGDNTDERRRRNLPEIRSPAQGALPADLGTALAGVLGKVPGDAISAVDRATLPDDRGTLPKP